MPLRVCSLWERSAEGCALPPLWVEGSGCCTHHWLTVWRPSKSAGRWLMRCIVSISSRRSGWICGQGAQPRPSGALSQPSPLPRPPIPPPLPEPHLIHGTNLQAQFVHHRDEQLGKVCM